MVRRLLGLVLLIGAAAAAGGCQTFAAEEVITPEAARQAIESRIGVTLVETPPVEILPTLTDVDAAYTMTTSNERLLMLVFSSADATVQFTGRPAGRPRNLVVRRNVVAVYEHDPGTTSRFGQLQMALDRLDRGGG